MFVTRTVINVLPAYARNGLLICVCLSANVMLWYAAFRFLITVLVEYYVLIIRPIRAGICSGDVSETVAGARYRMD